MLWPSHLPWILCHTMSLFLTLFSHAHSPHSHSDAVKSECWNFCFVCEKQQVLIIINMCAISSSDYFVASCSLAKIMLLSLFYMLLGHCCYDDAKYKWQDYKLSLCQMFGQMSKPLYLEIKLKESTPKMLLTHHCIWKLWLWHQDARLWAVMDVYNIHHSVCNRQFR